MQQQAWAKYKISIEVESCDAQGEPAMTTSIVLADDWAEQRNRTTAECIALLLGRAMKMLDDSGNIIGPDSTGKSQTRAFAEAWED